MAPITPRKSPGSNGTQLFRNKIGRKKLQTLQVSANDRSVLVGGQRLSLFASSPNKRFSIFHDSEMKSNQENDTSEVKLAKTASVKPRRSQRKRQAIIPSISNENDEQKMPDSKEGGKAVAKSSKKTRKSNKTSAKVASKQTKEQLRQRKIMFCCLSKQTISSSGSDPESAMELKLETISESSKVIDSNLKKAELPEIVLSHVPSSDVPPESPQHTVAPKELEISEDFRYLIMDSEPPESYWKEIAEQRIAALEETLCENAKLNDEIEVLKAENSHLLSLVEAGRELALLAHQYVLNCEGGNNQS